MTKSMTKNRLFSFGKNNAGADRDLGLTRLGSRGHAMTLLLWVYLSQSSGYQTHPSHVLFVLALFVHVPFVSASPRQEVVSLSAIVERDQQMGAEIPVRQIHLRVH